MTDRDEFSGSEADAPQPATETPTDTAQRFVALNQSHWRAVEEVLDGLRQGRSFLVLVGPQGAGAGAVMREVAACLPRRLQAIESGPQAATVKQISSQLHARLCANMPTLGQDERPAEQLRAALEALAHEDRGVVYVVDPEEPLTEDALVFLARLAAGGRRMTRARAAMLEEVNEAPRGPVGAQIVLCAPPEALPALINLGDSALRRAAETAIRIAPFDGPAIRALFRQNTGAVLAPGAVAFALEATGGAQRHVEQLLQHPILTRAAKSATEGADPGAGEAPTVNAQTVARAIDAMGLQRPEDADAAALDARDIRAGARLAASGGLAGGLDRRPDRREPAAEGELGDGTVSAPVTHDAADHADRAVEAEFEDGEQGETEDDAVGTLSFASPIESDLREPLAAHDDAEPAPERKAQGDASAYIAGLEDLEDEAEGLSAEECVDAAAGAEAATEFDAYGEIECEAEREENAAAPASSITESSENTEQSLEASSEDQERLEDDTASSGDDDEDVSEAEDVALENAEEDAPVDPNAEQAALRGALDAAEASLSPEAMEAAGEDADPKSAAGGKAGAVSRLIASLGPGRENKTAKRLGIEAGPKARTLGSSRRHAAIAATVGAAALAAGALLHYAPTTYQGAGAMASFGGEEILIETADARLAEPAAGGAAAGDEAGAAIWNDLMGGALAAVEHAARGAADTVAPTQGASRGLNKLADQLFTVREEIGQDRLEEELAALPPGKAAMWRASAISTGLRSAEDLAAAGRYTSPEGANAYEALLKVYPLAPRDPRIRGALAALVEHYDKAAAQALTEERYADFHDYNRIADRIRARLPI